MTVCVVLFLFVYLLESIKTIGDDPGSIFTFALFAFLQDVFAFNIAVVSFDTM